jgi:hypothetical protein
MALHEQKLNLFALGTDGSLYQGCSQGKPKTRHELILSSVLAGGRGVGGEGGR